MKESSLHPPGTLIRPGGRQAYLYQEEDNMFLMLVGSNEAWENHQLAVTLGHESHDGKFFDILLGERILWVRTDQSYARVTQ